MTPEEAKELLLLHCGAHEDITHSKMETGFLGSLRPYIGLNQNNLHEVMEAIRVLAPEFQLRTVDREVMNALWGMCHFARAWGVHPDGMLRRNNLIEPEDVQRLEEWISAISYAVAMLLDDNDIVTAFDEYNSLKRN